MSGQCFRGELRRTIGTDSLAATVGDGKVRLFSQPSSVFLRGIARCLEVLLLCQFVIKHKVDVLIVVAPTSEDGIDVVGF